jgi:light-regulated signal transduction histidine kinase (bacteriophytochrome)
MSSRYESPLCHSCSDNSVVTRLTQPLTGQVAWDANAVHALNAQPSDNSEPSSQPDMIRRLNCMLQRSNDELNQFAYSASHDLQEPLRKVVGFCQALRDDYDELLDETARSYIEHAVEGAMRMRSLIADLLTYSRVHTQGEPMEAIDSGLACDEASHNLRASIDNAGAIVSRGQLPIINGDQSQLVRLFQNLIGNAIKYRSDESPCVHVNAEESHGEWVFRVRDNGLGIDPQYSDRIFVIFQRLHSRAEYPGTGAGLAISKRIVERMGGRIWVESSLGHGSVFCFTASKSPSREPSEQRMMPAVSIVR